MENGDVYVILVQRREELAMMPLAIIPTSMKKDDAITSVLYGRILRPRDLIWSVLQSPTLKRHRSRRTCQDFVRIYKPKTFTSEVKVVPLTYYEELLIRYRAMCLILCYRYRHILFFVVFSKTAFLGLKSIVVGPNYYVTTANCSTIFPLFL